LPASSLSPGSLIKTQLDRSIYPRFRGPFASHWIGPWRSAVGVHFRHPIRITCLAHREPDEAGLCPRHSMKVVLAETEQGRQCLLQVSGLWWAAPMRRKVGKGSAREGATASC